MDAFCHITPVLGDFRSMQIWLDIFDTPRQNFMDAFRHVTPVLGDFRSMQV